MTSSSSSTYMTTTNRPWQQPAPSSTSNSNSNNTSAGTPAPGGPPPTTSTSTPVTTATTPAVPPSTTHHHHLAHHHHHHHHLHPASSINPSNSPGPTTPSSSNPMMMQPPPPASASAQQQQQPHAGGPSGTSAAGTPPVGLPHAGVGTPGAATPHHHHHHHHVYTPGGSTSNNPNNPIQQHSHGTPSHLNAPTTSAGHPSSVHQQQKQQHPVPAPAPAPPSTTSTSKPTQSTTNTATISRPHKNAGSNPYEIHVPPPPSKLVPKTAKQVELESLHSNDIVENYTTRPFPPSLTLNGLDLEQNLAHIYGSTRSRSSSPTTSSTKPTITLPRPTRTLPRGNRGHKLSPDAPLQRRGRMYPWSPLVVEDLYGNPYGYGGETRRIEREDEERVRKRLRGALRVVLPSAAVEAGEVVPSGKGGEDESGIRVDEESEMGLSGSSTRGKRKRKDHAPIHLRTPSPTHRRQDIITSLSLIQPPPTSNLNSDPLAAPPLGSTSMGMTYLDLSTSPAVRYTLGIANKEKALMRTVDDLIDGETGLKGVLSRLLRVMEVAGRERSRLFDTKVAGRQRERGREREREVRGEEGGELGEVGVDAEAPVPAQGEVSTEPTAENGSTVGPDPDVKMEVDDENGHDNEIKPTKPPVIANVAATADPRSRQASSSNPAGKPALDSSFLFGSGEPFFVPPGSMVTYEPVDPSTPQDPDVVDIYPETDLNPLQRLFVTSTGLTTTIGPSPQDPRLHLPLTHPGYPHTTCVRLTPETQKQSVICAMDKIKELASDCQEYVCRLEEIRERLANVGRARRKVWQIVRERAILANDGELGDGEADVETMRLRAEAEHAIAGTQVETRRRRGVATAVASAVAS